jgi:hypothetical protein
MSLLIRALAPALSLFLFSATVMAQVLEEETNDPCSEAQIIDWVTPPFQVVGNLDSSQEPDVDFFRVMLPAGTDLQVDLEGETVGMGTLHDPYLGFFNASCELQAANDDAGGMLNSRLFVTVPEGGAILAVTLCCDGEFLGGGEGSYTLTVSPAAFIGSIAGRAVDADTWQPLPGDAPPLAWAELRACDEGGCWMGVASQALGPDGTFLFETNFMGQPIPAGEFAVVVMAMNYAEASFGPFAVAEGEHFDAGDIPVAPFEVIGAITGRIVEGLTGEPLSGTSTPFSRVDLQRCEEWGCYPVVNYIPAGEDGRFRIEGMPWALPPGMYQVVAFADDYVPHGTDPIFVGDDEEVDFGDIALTPLPIGYGEITGCDFLPIGGTCEFSVQVTNRRPGRYRGEAWAIARYFSVNYPNLANRFQIGRLGAQNPNPIRVNLAQGKTTTLTFRLDVPATAPEGTSLCITANVGRDPAPQFDAAGERLLFCAVAQPGGLARLSAKESNALLKKLEPKER